MPSHRFRENPSDEIVLRAAQSVGLFSLTDTKWFDKSFWNKALMVEVAEAIEPIYYPCFARHYIFSDKSELTFSEWMTICRQLFRTRGIQLERKDKHISLGDGVYATIPKYRIKVSTIPPLTQSVSIQLL